jgi:hypothetical protein
VYWALVRGREWSIGMTIMFILGTAFVAFGIFANRKWISEADF